MIFNEIALCAMIYAFGDETHASRDNMPSLRLG